MVSQVFCLLCLKRLTFFFVELILGISKLEFAESRSTIFVDTAVLGVGGRLCGFMTGCENEPDDPPVVDTGGCL